MLTGTLRVFDIGPSVVAVLFPLTLRPADTMATQPGAEFLRLNADQFFLCAGFLATGAAAVIGVPVATCAAIIIPINTVIAIPLDAEAPLHGTLSCLRPLRQIRSGQRLYVECDGQALARRRRTRAVPHGGGKQHDLPLHRPHRTSRG